MHVIEKQGNVRWRDVETDYKIRPTNRAILAAQTTAGGRGEGNGARGVSISGVGGAMTAPIRWPALHELFATPHADRV